MADTDPAATDSTGQPSDGGADAGDRLDRVENKLDRLTEAVAAIVPGSHADAEQRTEDRLDRGTSVEEQVRAELTRAQAAQAEQDKKDREAAELAGVKETVAKLTEQRPTPPVPLRERLLGWTR